MSAVPPPSRRVLDDLHPRLSSAGPDPRAATPVGRALTRLETALDAHRAALAELDGIEARVVAARGHPRVRLPAVPGAAPEYAADATTIKRRLGPGRVARRLRAELRARQRGFAEAAAVAGFIEVQAREARTARELSDAAASLLLAPVVASGDVALKLAVLIAAGEATADDAFAFPWLYLRTLLADLTSAPQPRSNA